MAADQPNLKPEGVKVIQIVSNTIPRPGPAQALHPEVPAQTTFSLALYGLGDDGMMYQYHFGTHNWVVA